MLWDAGGALRGDPRGARLVVLHQRAHGVPGGVLWLPQACGALPGCDLQHPPPGIPALYGVTFYPILGTFHGI